MSLPVVVGLRGNAFADEPAVHQGVPPTVLPAVRRFHAGPEAKGIVAATRIVVDPAAMGSLRQVADVLAEELVAEGHVSRAPQVVATRSAKPHDIELTLGPLERAEHPEAYSITAGPPLTIASRTAAGVFWGTRTLVQVLRGGPFRGKITDWPGLAERSLLLDVGRKYFTPEWIKALIREMSFLKMNAIQLHISEGLGFRVECATHPEIVLDQHLTKAEVRDILAFAKRYHVAVNGDVDTPGHLDHILSFHPEHQLVLADGTRKAGFLDFSRPGARRLVHDVIGEMCDLFDGPVFHLGGDEFFPAPWEGTGPDVVSDRTAPQLVRYARQVTGNQAATAHDGYEFYMNELADLVRAKGKTPRMFNDDVYPGEGVTRVDPRTQVDVWIRWNDTKPDAGEYASGGHQLINANGDYLYFILTAEGLGTGPYKNPKGIYERWTPRTFMGAAGSAGDYLLPEDQPVFGAHLSVWCDSPDSMGQDEVARLLQPWLQVFAQQVWGSARPVPTLEDFETDIAEKVGVAPVVQASRSPLRGSP